MSGRETELVKVVIAYLRALGYMAWRVNTGAMSGEHKGKRRYVQFSTPGASDVFAVQPGTGRFVAIECKVGSRKPTEQQERFLTEVEAVGGIAGVAWSIDDVAAMLMSGKDGPAE